MLWQMHQHLKDDSAMFYSQIDTSTVKTTDNGFQWMRDVMNNVPLQEGARWAVCSEDAPCFIFQKEKTDVQE